MAGDLDTLSNKWTNDHGNVLENSVALNISGCMGWSNEDLKNRLIYFRLLLVD